MATQSYLANNYPQLECCGITGPGDYNGYEPRLNPSFSCCPDDGTDRASEIKRSDCLSLEKYYKDGCETKVLGTIHSAGLTVIVCGILFCFLEVSQTFVAPTSPSTKRILQGVVTTVVLLWIVEPFKLQYLHTSTFSKPFSAVTNSNLIKISDIIRSPSYKR